MNQDGPWPDLQQNVPVIYQLGERPCDFWNQLGIRPVGPEFATLNDIRVEGIDIFPTAWSDLKTLDQ